MTKILEKTLKDSIKESSCTVGTRQVLNSAASSKLIVVSESVDPDLLSRINEAAEKNNVPTVRFHDSSVALGKLCGLQFRISTISFAKLTDASVKALIKEAETK